MQCTSPVLIKNPRAVLGDRYSFGLWVPCGHCVSCRIARAREWSTRLLHELDFWDEASFFTLTYDEEHLPPDNSISKRELQLFFKRLRKELGPRKIKYFACGEYGERYGRAHYHAIVFGLGTLDVGIVERCWNLGSVHRGTVTYDSCRYVADYIGKSYNGALALEVYGGRQPPFQLVSGGIGKRWAERHVGLLNDTLTVHVNGAPVGLPRYYRKVLGITTEQMAEGAIASADELKEFWKRKGVQGEAELARALWNARKQANRTAIARQSLYKRDKH